MNLLTINEIAQKLDEWAKRKEPKLPEHLGHISFYGSLLKALGNLPDLVLTWLQSRMPEQFDSIQKDLDDLYEKAKAVDHERSESGREANILKCQAQAAAKKLAKKLWFLEDIDKSCSKQTEIKKEPAETKQNATPAKGGGIKKGICFFIIFLVLILATFRLLGWPEPIKAFKGIYSFIIFLAALLTCLYHLGALNQIKTIVHNILMRK